MLDPAAFPEELPDQVFGAAVQFGEVGPPPPGSTQLSEQVWVTEEVVWAEVEGYRVLVHGTEVAVLDVGDDADPSMVGPMIYSWATRAVALHAGRFSLHASLVRVGDEHVMIGGHSGAGKSTTVAALAHRHGATVLIDDVVHLDMVDGRPVARPFPRPIHLMDDAVERLGLEVSGTRIGTGPYSKTAVAVEVPDEPVPVDQLVTLLAFDPDPSEDWPNTILPTVEPTTDEPVVARTVTGAERLRWVVRLANNGGLASFGSRAVPFFEWSTQVAGTLPTLEIARLRGADTLDRVCETIIETATRPPD